MKQLVDGGCPRRAETGSTAYGPDRWDRRHGRKGPRSCSYCGSMHPDDFMAAIASGVAELGPTDKSYKVYVEIATVLYTPTSSRFVNGKQTDIVKYPKRPATLKFYFQHLSEEQMREFVRLYNEDRERRVFADDMSFTVETAGAMKLGWPGRFYSPPFFMTRG